MQVEEFLEFSAVRFPDRIGLVCGSRRLSYREIEEQSNQLANAMIALGIQRGDRVAIYLENSVEAVLSIFGTLKVGAVFLMVNPTTKPEKLTYILNNCRARGLICHSTKLDSMRNYWSLIPHLESVMVVGHKSSDFVDSAMRFVALEDLLAHNVHSMRCPPKKCIDIDLAALIYTSGSTGNSKGVMMTHLNIVSAATSITTYLESVPDDVILNVLPLSFDYGLYQVLMGFKVGGTIILERSFTYPHAVIEKIAHEKVTGFPVVPTIVAILLQMDLTKYDFSSLRYLTNTAAALPAHHIFQLRKLFPRTKIYSMYGLTECKRVSYLAPDQIDIRPTSVGKGMPNEEVYIVDEHGNRVGPGVVGELVVRGANVMRGYWEMPEETGKVLKPGPLPGENVLYTGDLFRTDEEGYFYFVGRRDDLIKSRGEKISPKEVENVLCSLEGVAEVAVVGVADEVLGQAIKAIIKLKNGTTLCERDVLRHCARYLEDYMVPKIVEFRDALPITANGKINKREFGVSTQ